jgi:hypothetical protein
MVGLETELYYVFAGMPLFAPSNPDLEEEAGGRVPIGTLCILDDSPRLEFSPSERAQLCAFFYAFCCQTVLTLFVFNRRSLASEVSSEIESWVSDRRSSISSFNSSATYSRAKHVSLDSSSAYIDWQARTNAAPLPTSASNGSAASRRTSLPPTPPASIRGPSTIGEQQEPDVIDIVLPPTTSLPSHTLPSTREEPSITDCTRPSRTPKDPRRPSAHPRPSSAPTVMSNPTLPSKPKSTFPSKPKPTFPSVRVRAPPKCAPQKLFDGATQALCTGLDLSLVYLVSFGVDSPDSPLTLLSSSNLPTTKPSFDHSLHLQALRVVEGGLLYRNPVVLSLPSGTMFEGPGYASGILLPVAEVGGKGWVLAGYTKDGERQFDEAELDYFMQVVEQVSKVVGWAKTAEEVSA